MRGTDIRITQGNERYMVDLIWYRHRVGNLEYRKYTKSEADIWGRLNRNEEIVGFYVSYMGERIFSMMVGVVVVDRMDNTVRQLAAMKIGEIGMFPPLKVVR